MRNLSAASTVQIQKQVKKNVIGLPLKTKEAYRHIRGNGKYVDDVRLPNMAFAAILRSPYAHATINSIDYSEARKLPGVIDILTTEDVVTMSDPLPQMTVPPASSIKDYPIAVGKACYLGEPIAVVIATSKYIAEDSLELINVDYQILQPLLDARKAVSTKDIIIHEEIGTNIMAHVPYSYGNIERATSQADKIIKANIHFHRFSSAPLEPNAVVADYNSRDGSLTVWCNNQEPSFMLPQFNSSLRLP